MRGSPCHLFLLLLGFILAAFSGREAGAARIGRLVVDSGRTMMAEVVHPRRLQSAGYCVAVAGADESKLQDGLDWACGTGSSGGNVDCSAILQGGSCYSPNTLQAHASYAFDYYYVKQGGAAGSCDFNGVATVTATDPSVGSCVFPSLASGVSTTSNSSISSPSSSSNTTSFGNSPTTTVGTTSSAHPFLAAALPSSSSLFFLSLFLTLFLPSPFSPL